MSGGEHARDRASIALRRFGLGPRPGELARAAADPRGYVLDQLDPARAHLEQPGLASSAAILTAVQDFRFEVAIARQMAVEGKSAPPPAAATASNTAPNASPNAEQPPTGDEVRPPRAFLAADMIARVERMLTTEAALVERLVAFWSNHFAISALKGQNVLAIAGAFEREAIRPHVLGRFGAMLKAVEQHPAMLIYLDNQLSVGPGSLAGTRRGRGLNENLAREILELHTLGVKGGYSEADVTNLARLITGWTVAGPEAPAPITPGQFSFTPNRHEPGRFAILGKTYGGNGLLSGEEALADLARHPATARHIARKLAAHFVSEKQPPPRLVDALEQTFKRTDGDLMAVTRTLVTAEDCWTAPPLKMTPPCDFAVSLVRGFTLRTPPLEIVRVAAALGQPLWRPPSPRGWTDDDHAWLGPSGVRERLRVAEKIAREVDTRADPRALARDLLGDAISEPSRDAIARAETREQALEILIMTPELQRR